MEGFLTNPMAADALREQLEGVYDVERLLSRIAYDAVNARDCLALCATLEAVPRIKAMAGEFSAPLIAETMAALDPMEDLTATLRSAISPDAPLSVREGGMIAQGYSAELDELRDVSANGKSYLAAMEQEERDKTGIKNAENRLQPRVRLLHGGHQVVLRRPGAQRLHPQADAGQLRALHHRGA